MRNLSKEAMMNLKTTIKNGNCNATGNTDRAEILGLVKFAVDFKVNARFMLVQDKHGDAYRFVRIHDKIVNLDGTDNKVVGTVTAGDQFTDGSDSINVTFKRWKMNNDYKTICDTRLYVPCMTDGSSYTFEEAGSRTENNNITILCVHGGNATVKVHRFIEVAATWAAATQQGCQDLDAMPWKLLLNKFYDKSLGEIKKAGLLGSMSEMSALQLLMCVMSVAFWIDESTNTGTKAMAKCKDVFLNDGAVTKAEWDLLFTIAKDLNRMVFPYGGALCYEVNHKDLNKSNNDPHNLELVTGYSNKEHEKFLRNLRGLSDYVGLFDQDDTCRYGFPAEAPNQFCGWFSQLPGVITTSPHWLYWMLRNGDKTIEAYSYSNWNNTNIFVKLADGSYRKITVKEHEALMQLSSQDRTTYCRARGNANARLQIINSLTDERDRNALMYCGNPKVITTTPPAGAQLRDALLIDECVTFAQALYGFAV